MPGHLPMFPMFVAKPPQRTLGVLTEEGEIVIEKTGHVFKPDSIDDLREVLFTKSLLLTVNTFETPVLYRFLKEAVPKYPDIRVCCNKKGEVISVKFFGKKNKIHDIVLASRWKTKDFDFEAEPENLPRLRDVFDHCGVGVHPTPASLGFALIQQSWMDAYGLAWRMHRHTSPSGGDVAFIRDHMSGGRADTPCLEPGGLGDYFDYLLMLDERGAYAAHFDELPDGTSIGFRGNHVEPFADFFAECTIQITSDLPLGPFPVRGLNKGSTNLVYPTRPGKYTAYLWKAQWEDCVRAGCDVKIGEGRGWKNVTHDGLRFVQLSESLRCRAPNKYVEGIIKAAIVGGIGRFGSRPGLYSLVPADKASKGDECLGMAGYATPWYIHREQGRIQPEMAHWFGGVIGRCASTLYNKALPYAQQERLVMSNYDSVMFKPLPNEHEQHIPKHSPNLKLGEWGYVHMYVVEILASRSYNWTDEEGNRHEIQPGRRRG